MHFHVGQANELTILEWHLMEVLGEVVIFSQTFSEKIK